MGLSLDQWLVLGRETRTLLAMLESGWAQMVAVYGYSGKPAGYAKQLHAYFAAMQGQLDAAVHAAFPAAEHLPDPDAPDGRRKLTQLFYGDGSAAFACPKHTATADEPVAAKRKRTPLPKYATSEQKTWMVDFVDRLVAFLIHLRGHGIHPNKDRKSTWAKMTTVANKLIFSIDAQNKD